MLVVTKLQPVNNRTAGKRKAADKGKQKKGARFSAVLDEKLQVTPSEPAKK